MTAPAAVRRTAPRRRLPAWLGPVLLVAAVWGGARAVWWLGYANGDDLVYAAYAWSFDRLPADHREFRVLPELAIRAAQAALGPTELAAALPSLLASATLLAAVAWLLGWPRRHDAVTTAALVVAATVPLEVVMASYPGATPVAAGLAALGTAGALRGGRRGRIAGAALLGLAFACHEITVFWIAALVVALLLTDRPRLRALAVPLAVAVVLPVAVEATVYGALAGRPLLRWAAAARETARTDPLAEFGGSWVRFLLWPLRLLVVSKQLGLDLLAVGALGAAAWRRLAVHQRALLLTLAADWLWLGYGTQVPWAYRPRSHTFHYFIVFALPIGALLVPAAHRLLGRRRALAVAALAVATHLACLAAGGRWGRNVEVSQALLGYAAAHPGERFVTDAATWDEMTALGGFRPPPNVVPVPAPAVLAGLLVDRGRPAAAWWRPPALRIDALLVNHERRERPPDPAFVAFAARVRRGPTLWRRPPRLKPALAPLVPLLGRHEVMLLDAGGEVVALPDRPRLAAPR